MSNDDELQADELEELEPDTFGDGGEDLEDDDEADEVDT